MQIDPKNCVLGVDIDFTVNEFIVAMGVEKLACLIALITGANWRNVYDELEAISQAVIGKDHVQIAAIERAFDQHIHCVGSPLMERLWSTAAKFLLYMESKGFNPENLYRQAVEAEGAFWHGVGKESKLYHDAHHFRDFVQGRELPMFALTSSDARTVYRSDIGLHGRIEYDVDHSVQMKHKRLAHSGVNEFIPAKDIIVSDPYRKEDRALWESQVFPRYPDRVDREQWMFLGDTAFDMEAAHVAGVGTRIFLNRHNSLRIPAEATHVVYSLTEATTLIQGLLV